MKTSKARVMTTTAMTITAEATTAYVMTTDTTMAKVATADATTADATTAVTTTATATAATAVATTSAVVTKTTSSGNDIILGIIAGISLLINLIIGCLVVFTRRRKRRRSKATQNPAQSLSAPPAAHIARSSSDHKFGQRPTGRPAVALSDIPKQDNDAVYAQATEVCLLDGRKASVQSHTYETVIDPKPSTGEDEEDTYDHLKYDKDDSEDSPSSTSAAATAIHPAPFSATITGEEEHLEAAADDPLKMKSASNQDKDAKPSVYYAEVNLSKKKEKRMTELKENPEDQDQDEADRFHENFP